MLIFSFFLSFLSFYNVFIPRCREINKGPPPSHLIEHGDVWTIVFQFPCCFDTPIVPDLSHPILRHSNLIWNLLVLYISRLIPYFLHSSQYTLKPMRSCLLRYSLCANPLHPLARCPTDSTSLPQTLHFGSTSSRSIVARKNLQCLFLSSKNIPFSTLS